MRSDAGEPSVSRKMRIVGDDNRPTLARQGRHVSLVFPGSETTVWTSFSADGAMLTYHLDRHAKPRIEFVLKRVARQEHATWTG